MFRAVAVIAGAQLSGCNGGTTAVPYLGIHGIHDSVLAISMGRSLRDKFLQLNGCASKNAPEPTQGSRTHIKTEYSCRAGLPVWWIAHDGDHVPDPSDANGFKWAPGETWTFFTQAIGGSSPTTTLVTSTTSAPDVPTASPNNPSCAVKYTQCGGGQEWSGPTCCESGSTCTFSNQWYSQCL